MTLEYAILGLLSWKSLTGYDIKKMFEGSPVLYWSGNNNQIYTTLVKLNKEGWVTRETHFQESAPPRKIYTITTAGLEALKQWLHTSPEMPQLRHAFLIQLAWADLMAPAELDALLEKYEEEVQIQFLMLRAQVKQGNHTPSNKLRAAYINPGEARNPREACLWSMIMDNWIQFYEHELNWVRNLRRELGSMPLNRNEETG